MEELRAEEVTRNLRYAIGENSEEWVDNMELANAMLGEGFVNVTSLVLLAEISRSLDRIANALNKPLFSSKER